MERPKLEVADIFRRYRETYRAEHEGSLSSTQRRVMRAVTACRTAALGGHLEACDACGHQRICYNSCRNRHCPKCQGSAAREWMEARAAELLPEAHRRDRSRMVALGTVLGAVAVYAFSVAVGAIGVDAH